MSCRKTSSDAQSKVIATSDRAYSSRATGNAWLVSSRTRAFRFRWSWRCRFVTKISCSIAAIGSICLYVAISSWKSKSSKRFFQSIKHKFLRTCDSQKCRLACLSISTSQSCKTAPNVSFCDPSCSLCPSWWLDPSLQKAGCELQGGFTFPAEHAGDFFAAHFLTHFVQV